MLIKFILLQEFCWLIVDYITAHGHQQFSNPFPTATFLCNLFFFFVALTQRILLFPF